MLYELLGNFNTWRFDFIKATQHPEANYKLKALTEN